MGCCQLHISLHSTHSICYGETALQKMFVYALSKRPTLRCSTTIFNNAFVGCVGRTRRETLLEIPTEDREGIAARLFPAMVSVRAVHVKLATF